MLPKKRHPHNALEEILRKYLNHLIYTINFNYSEEEEKPLINKLQCPSVCLFVCAIGITKPPGTLKAAAAIILK